MEKIELSPSEAISALGWKKSKVYYWISTGKFETVERMDGQKIVLSPEDFERLKKNNFLESEENFENFSNGSTNYEKFQNNQVQNDTKLYRNEAKSFTSEQFEFMQNALETVKQIHQSSLQTYSYNVKLLTDGQNHLEEENLKLKSEYKSVEEKLKQSESEKMEISKKYEMEKREQIKTFRKVGNVQKCIILVLTILLLVSLVLFFTNLNSLKKIENDLELQKVENTELVKKQSELNQKVQKLSTKRR
jgi:hypothetical protein